MNDIDPILAKICQHFVITGPNHTWKLCVYDYFLWIDKYEKYVVIEDKIYFGWTISEGRHDPTNYNFASQNGYKDTFYEALAAAIDYLCELTIMTKEQLLELLEDQKVMKVLASI